jgi:hypothetical protein
VPEIVRADCYCGTAGYPPANAQDSHSLSTSCVCCPGTHGELSTAAGVRENGGAGDGWVMPSPMKKVLRAANCGWSGASDMPSTGATQASLSSNSFAHSRCGAGCKGGADRGSQLRPCVSVELRSRIQWDFEQAQELGIELRFERPDGYELCIRGLIDAVERRTAITEVGAALVGPDSRRVTAVDHGHQMGGAINDRRVDHLAAAASSGLVQRRQHTEQQVHASAGEVADKVEWDLRVPTGLADRVQRSGGCDIGDVVSGGVGERAVLTPLSIASTGCSATRTA